MQAEKVKTGEIVVDYFDKILISYVREDNTKGCKKCLLKRFLNTRKDRLNVGNKKYANVSADLYKHFVELMVENLRNDSKLVDSKGRRKFFIFDKNDFSVEVDYFIPVPDCDTCGTLEEDSSELAEAMGRKIQSVIYSQEKHPFRSKRKSQLYKELEETILSKNVGIVTTIMDSTAGPLPLAVALLPVENGNDEPGSGRMSTIEDSRAVAMFEAIERYAGFMPRGKKTVIYDTYENLKRNYKVLDVSKIILHENSLSANSKFSNEEFRFDYERKYHWVYGYNLTTSEPVLVPETLGYYGMKLKHRDYIGENFVYEISNGCSVGGTLAEAAYFSLMEVVERDAFLSSWYTSRKIKKIIIDDFSFEGGEELLKELKLFEDYYKDFKINFYDVTNDVGVPTVLATMMRIKISEKELNFMCAASADVNIVTAVTKALHELSSVYLGFQEKFQTEYEKIEMLTEDLSKVEDMLEHSLVYGYYKNVDKIHFEDNVVENYNLKDHIENKSYSLNEAFKEVIEKLERIDKEAIVVDQTTEEMMKMGIRCTKVLVPGLLPMTFNAKNIRISKERIDEIQKMQDEELKVRFLPHPFP